MKLILPEPDIDLYYEGFEPGKDLLDRAATGKRLSGLVERIDDPIVIALDGAWGSGKSFFLKCWVGAHTLQNDGTATTVYFDAFAHDFLDDPLIALTLEISKRFKENSPQATAISKIKEYAPALGRAALRVGISAATLGVVNKADELGDTIAEAVGGELGDAAADFWKREDGKRAAMEAFRSALVELTAPDKKSKPTQKLVIVIDELDRCRPDYALSLLEIIKHFFAVPGVHFVLGVNLRELENSVQARYGVGINAAKYLQKFVNLIAPLRGAPARNPNQSTLIRYYQHICRETEFEGDWRSSWINDYLQLVDHHVGMSLRDIERLVTLAKITPDPNTSQSGHPHLFAGLLILRVVSPELVEKARHASLTFSDVTKIFRIEKRSGDQTEIDAHCAWKLATDGMNSSTPEYIDTAASHLFSDQPAKEVLRSIIARSLDTFALPDHR